MTNSNNTILVQNIETFETIITLPNMAAFDEWMDDSSQYGIVSLDADADGEYGFVALVASDAGPDYIMDMGTGEMEPVEQIDPAAELAAKMDIMMELDMNDVAQEDILAMIADEPLAPVPAPVEDIIDIREEFEAVDIYAEQAAAKTITPKKPRKTRKAKTQSNKGAKMRNFEILAAFISANPGVSRTDVFTDAGLQSSLRTPAQIKSIASGDKAEVKRWNRRLNFLIREMRRQNVDIQIERKGRVAHYTVGQPSGQLELPFTPAAEARNSAIIGEVEVELLPSNMSAMRLLEAPDQSLDFEALLATLDDEAVAPVTK